jgi:RNA polymerase sigma-70 factor (ECF subfamily)
MYEPHNDIARLIQRCIDCDDTAQAEFYTRFEPLVRRAVVRKLNVVHANSASFGEVDDICNEIFARLFAECCAPLQRLKNPQAIEAWLMTVAQNHTITYLRRVANRSLSDRWYVHEETEVYIAGPDVPAVQEEQIERVGSALAALPAHDRVVLELFYLQGLKYAEIGDIMKMNINTVAARIRRAKVKLREALEEDMEDLV